MKRRLICAMLALAICLSAGSAMGEDFAPASEAPSFALSSEDAFAAVAEGYWTSNDDLYYHDIERCGGAAGRVPISLEGARAFEKYPCPVCVASEDGGEKPRAAARSDIIVVRFSDEWLAKQSAELDAAQALSLEEHFEGARAEALLAQCFHGAAYAAFLETGMGTAIVPDVRDEVLGARHLGNAWYVIVRPAAKFDSKYELNWEARIGEFHREADGALGVDFPRTIGGKLNLSLELLHGSKAVYSRKGAPEINVFTALDTNVAVIYESDPDEYRMADVTLRIGSADIGPLTGRIQSGRALYYCALTDAELQALNAGAELRLVHPDYASGADFGGGDRAIVRAGKRFGVIDREGEFVEPPVYLRILRPEGCETAEPKPFFLETEAGDWRVADGETLKLILKLSGERPDYDNQAMCHAGADYYSLASGKLAFRLSDIGVDFIEGGYAVRTEGLPQRMVAWRGDGADTAACLIDNDGGFILGAKYRRVTALYWQGERGVYLVEDFDPNEYAPDGLGGERYRLGANYAGAWIYGPHWRCGLIDENGEALTELRYTAIECDADGSICLTAEDGSVETHTLDELLDLTIA